MKQRAWLSLEGLDLMNACRRAWLALRAAKAAASEILGSYSSLVKGIGLEYADLREYTWSDDAKFIDWRASARSVAADGGYKLLVREFHDERRVRSIIAVDLSRSIEFWDKLESTVYASTLVLELARRLGDEVDLVLLRRGDAELYPRVDPRRAMHVIVGKLCKEGASGTARLSKLASKLRSLGRKRCLLLVTDYAHSLDEIRSLALSAKACATTVGIVLVTAAYELEPPLREARLYLAGPELGAVKAWRLSEFYERVAGHVKSVRAFLRASLIPFVEVKGFREARQTRVKIARTYLAIRWKRCTL